MKSFSIQNQKGGPGKTTLSLNIADCLRIKGLRVQVIDTDIDQQTATQWSERNQGEYLDVVQISAASVDGHIKRNTGNYDYYIIDCPPEAKVFAAKIIKAVDLVIIPVEPAAFSCWACHALIDQIEVTRINTSTPLDDGRPDAVFILNKVVKNTRLIGETKENLKQFNIDVLGTMCTNLQAFVRSTEYGETVFNFRESCEQAKNEIIEITNQIIGRLEDE